MTRGETVGCYNPASSECYKPPSVTAFSSAAAITKEGREVSLLRETHAGGSPLLFTLSQQAGLVVGARSGSTCGTSKHHPHERISLSSSPPQIRDQSGFEKYWPIVRRPNRVVDCIKVFAPAAAVKIDSRRPLEHICMPTLYLLATTKHFVRCHKSPSSVKSAATAAASFLLYASSSSR